MCLYTRKYLTWSASQVKTLVPDAFGEIAFPAGERLFQNGANHEAGPKQELGVEPKGKRVLRELVPHRSSHGGSSQCLQSKEGVEMGKEEVAKQENLPGIEKNLCNKLHLIRTAASSPRLAGSCAIMPFSGCGLKFIQFFLVYSGCNHTRSIVIPGKWIKSPQLVPPE